MLEKVREREREGSIIIGVLGKRGYDLYIQTKGAVVKFGEWGI